MKTRELIIIVIAVIITSAMSFTIASHHKMLNNMKEDQQIYVDYIDAVENLLNEMEDSCVLENFLDGDNGAKYLEASKKLTGEISRYKINK